MKSLGHSFSEIFFLRNAVVGALLAVVTLITPNVGIAGIISVLAAYLFARFIGMSKSFLDSGYYTYNALLVGLSIGYLFELTVVSLFFVITAGLFTYLLSIMIEQIFGYYLRLPALSLPFALVSSTAYLAAYNYSNLYVSSAYLGGISSGVTLLPFWLEGFFNSMGAIIFSPNIYTGILISAVILLASRILFLLALMGFYLGATLSGLMDGAAAAAFVNINNFNFILIAMALGGVFLVPSPRSYIIAAIAVAIATVLVDAAQLFWAGHGIPVFTLPFNLITLTFLYVLKLVDFPLVAPAVRPTPEETLDDYLSNQQRFEQNPRKLALPFGGSWKVWQAFDGPWTHQGPWRYAYDFIIEKAGSSHSNDGSILEDYYAYKKPVRAPHRGRVVKVIDHLPDNPPGQVDTLNNWGNLVIIDTELGWFIELSHFAQHSIQVREGEWLEEGTTLGLCGNSGYSPQPHIHMQVQLSPRIGTETVPFAFHGYLHNNQHITNQPPEQDMVIEPAHAERGLEFKTGFVLDQVFEFEIEQNEIIQLRVAINAAGETCLQSNRGRLYFNRDRQSFYFYRLEGDDSWLAFIFSAVPRLPLLYRRGLSWQDRLPVAAVHRGWRKALLNLARAINPDIGGCDYRARWQSEQLIVAELSGSKHERVEIHLHPQLGFEQIRIGSRTLTLSNTQFNNSREERSPCDQTVSA